MRKDNSRDKVAAALRKQAEELLASRQAHVLKTTPDDPNALIHELQVHQIELEMQNEELRAMQETIENSRKRFSDLYDYAPVGYLTVDNKGIMVEANLTASELLEYERIRLIGKPITAFINREDQDTLYLHLRRLREGQSQTCEVRLVKKSGKSFFAQLMTVPFTGGGTRAEDYLMTVLDISERKIAEETRARLASIIDDADDAIISQTLDGTIVSWNRGAERMYGYREDEVKGLSVSMLAPPDRPDEIPDILRKTKDGGVVQHFETIRKRRDGSLVPVSLTVSPIRTGDGRIVGASTIARDITERKKWQQSVMDLNERLQVSNRELEALGHTLAHDLRAPLRGILGFTRILTEDCAERLDEECNRHLNRVNSSALLLDGMVTGLLNISRIAQTEIHREKLDLSALVRSIFQEYLDAEPGRAVEIVVQDGLSVMSDLSLVRTALDNLIRNALKFTRKRPNARIEFGLTESQGSAAFFLRDNGAGFDMKYANKMFTLFYRFHANAEFEGTGIGLATVQRIIRRHGGKIWAEGEVDKGATFYFTLP